MPMIATYTEPNLEQLLSPYIWHINISPINENIYDSLSENIMCFQFQQSHYKHIFLSQGTMNNGQIDINLSNRFSHAYHP